MTQPPLRVLLVDDDIERSKSWKAHIAAHLQGSADVDNLSKDASRAAIKAAITRRHRTRSSSGSTQQTEPCVFDDADILVLDYDLQELLAEDEWITGVEVAELARLFTRAKTIVLVNQFGTNNFDLTMVKGARSIADFDVGSAQITNPQLWLRAGNAEYSPWNWWDGLVAACERSSEATAWVQANLDQKVLETLGFTTDPEAPNFIPKEYWGEWLPGEACTFRELISMAGGIPEKDRSAILRDDFASARYASAYVTRWLERWVIPAGDILVDAPHLAYRFPWCLKDNIHVATWERFGPAGDCSALLLDGVQAHKFGSPFPVARPIYWSAGISSDPALKEPQGFSFGRLPDLVFCEDISKFAPFEDAKAFQSRLPATDPQRFVANGVAIDEPQPQYACVEVTYEPSVLFAL